MDAWPRRSRTCASGTPFSTSRDAYSWRRSCQCRLMRLNAAWHSAVSAVQLYDFQTGATSCAFSTAVTHVVLNRPTGSPASLLNTSASSGFFVPSASSCSHSSTARSLAVAIGTRRVFLLFVVSPRSVMSPRAKSLAPLPRGTPLRGVLLVSRVFHFSDERALFPLPLSSVVDCGTARGKINRDGKVALRFCFRAYRIGA